MRQILWWLFSIGLGLLSYSIHQCWQERTFARHSTRKLNWEDWNAYVLTMPNRGIVYRIPLCLPILTNCNPNDYQKPQSNLTLQLNLNSITMNGFLLLAIAICLQQCCTWLFYAGHTHSYVNLQPNEDLISNLRGMSYQPAVTSTDTCLCTC
jgi:hypothetical protein